MKVCYQNFDTDIHGDASDDFNRWCSEFRTDAKSMQEVTDQLEDDLRWIRTLADDTKTEINTIRIQEQLDRIEQKLKDAEDTKSDFEKAKQKIDDAGGGNGLEYMPTDYINKICDKFSNI